MILNEVNSSNPSQLKGYVEAAGKKADVIIANPSGIHCASCGVINSGCTTFTTGKPHIKDGQVDSFTVEKGLDVISNIATDSNLEWIQQTGTKGSLYTKKVFQVDSKLMGLLMVSKLE
ncbi:heme utilization or adhesion protein [Actinobacillus seminis]|uniref:Heme utilization or adhesion protein n=1 Tax=Actinobacillus seminis TaxID=722 RepID=A0A380VCU4_9PAST|nr:filamentous hemagglutinin N-terminal domain-containing protein [Actinobacillus seminis]SUU36073.1 heme utilization or adhesion protein [Actinobacillus seminis]